MEFMGRPLGEVCEPVSTICGQFLRSEYNCFELLPLSLFVAPPRLTAMSSLSVIWMRKGRNGPVKQCSTTFRKPATLFSLTFLCGRYHWLK